MRRVLAPRPAGSLALLAPLSLLLSGCGDSGADSRSGRDRTMREVIAVTSAPAGWLVELSGSTVPADSIPEQGADPRTWRPGDDALDDLVGAARVLLVSEEFEPWTQRAGLPPSRTLELVDLVDGGQLLHTAGVEHTHGNGPAHSHGGLVGTVWSDPKMLAELPRALADALGQDPRSAQEVEGLEAYRAALAALGEAARGKGIIASDHGLEYVARAAGFELRVALLECDEDGPTNQRGILQAQAFSEMPDDSGLLVWVGDAPQGGFAETASEEFGLRSVRFDLGARTGSNVLEALTHSAQRLTDALTR